MRAGAFQVKTLLPLFIAAWSVCPALESGEAAAPVKVDYTVSVEDLSRGRLHVAMRVAGCRPGTLLLHGVPFYAENPTPQATGDIVSHLRVGTLSARALQFDTTRDAKGQPVYCVYRVEGDIKIEYDLLVRFQESSQTRQYAILLPFMDSERAWLYGNCIFLHPELPAVAGRCWSQPMEITVRFEAPFGIPLVGVPAESISFTNLYQLLSLQFGFGKYVSEPGEAAGVRFDLLYRSPDEFSDAERAALRRTTSNLVRSAVRLFGGAPFNRFGFLFLRREGDSFAGLEGPTSCQAAVAKGLDISDPSGPPANYFYSLIAHEFIHSWNPVSFFAAEDPWIKEGLTEYYGNVFGARLGYYSEGDVEGFFNRYYRLLDENPLINQVALTDSRLRDESYTGESWRTVTYERGQVVALLLDVLIREKTQNRRSLDDVMRGLFQAFRGRTFSHRQFLETVRKETEVDPTEFFAAFVEGKEAPPEILVREKLRKARKLGVFDQVP